MHIPCYILHIMYYILYILHIIYIMHYILYILHIIYYIIYYSWYIMYDILYVGYIYIYLNEYIYIYIIVYTEKDVVEGWVYGVLKKPVKTSLVYIIKCSLFWLSLWQKGNESKGKLISEFQSLKMEVSCNISLKPIGQECASSTDCALAAVQLHAVKGQEDRDGWGRHVCKMNSIENTGWLMIYTGLYYPIRGGLVIQ
jgi:hypothetical protein